VSCPHPRSSGALPTRPLLTYYDTTTKTIVAWAHLKWDPSAAPAADTDIIAVNRIVGDEQTGKLIAVVRVQDKAAGSGAPSSQRFSVYIDPETATAVPVLESGKWQVGPIDYLKGGGSFVTDREDLCGGWQKVRWAIHLLFL